MRSPETSGGGGESQGGEDRIGRSSRQAQQTELSINDRFTRRFLSLFGDSPETRQAASTLLTFTQEISQHGRTFDLLILSELKPYLSKRYTLLRFGETIYPVEVQVGRWGEEADGGPREGQLDARLRFSGSELDSAADIMGNRVIFTGSNFSTELAVFRDGSIGVRPKARQLTVEDL